MNGNKLAPMEEKKMSWGLRQGWEVGMVDE